MKKTFSNSIVKENPIFVLMLGLCSSLAITTTLENAIVMGLSVMFVLIFSNFIISLLKKVIPENVKIPCYILIISTFVTIVDILLKKYAPMVSTTLGIYIPLIIVNCLILGRALNFASKKSVGLSLIDALGTGIGYTLALMLIALIREVLGSGTITIINNLSSLLGTKLIINLPKFELIPNQLFISPAGAFITIGILLAIFNSRRKDEKNESN